MRAVVSEATGQSTKEMPVLQRRCWGNKNKKSIYKLKRDKYFFKKEGKIINVISWQWNVLINSFHAGFWIWPKA